jgi:hypothetical protein
LLSTLETRLPISEAPGGSFRCLRALLCVYF